MTLRRADICNHADPYPVISDPFHTPSATENNPKISPEMCPRVHSPFSHAWVMNRTSPTKHSSGTAGYSRPNRFLEVRSYRVGNRTALQSSIQCCNNVSPVTIDSSLSEFPQCAGKTLIVLSRFELTVDYTGT